MGSWIDEISSQGDVMLAKRDNPRSMLYHMGSYRLMVAVLEQALVDLAPRGPESAKTHFLNHDTLEWFLSDCNEWFYSFHNICDHIGMDKNELRRRLFYYIRPVGGDTQAYARTNREAARSRPARPNRRHRG